MMSPLAVAQYVPKGSIQFDLCIIDEASQMPPESAIGALLRCGQTVVVGDTNQLPPSSFFKTLIDDEEAQKGRPGTGPCA
jgi:superfamily I DNA and/or RNA helicase